MIFVTGGEGTIRQTASLVKIVHPLDGMLPALIHQTSFHPGFDACQSLFCGRHVRLQGVKAPAQAAEHAPVQADNGHANDYPEFSTRAAARSGMPPPMDKAAVKRLMNPADETG